MVIVPVISFYSVTCDIDDQYFVFSSKRRIYFNILFLLFIDNSCIKWIHPKNV